MLNIQSKKEVQETVETNLNRFENTKEEVIRTSFKRDEEIILSDILPRLRHTVALTRFVKSLEWFYFSLPLIDFEGYDLTDEEQERILNEYYQKEGILWLNRGYGEKTKASMVKDVFALQLNTSISFKTCEMNREAKTVNFSLHLVDAICKNAKVKNEITLISNKLDEFLKDHIRFETIARKINACYKTLTDGNVYALYQGDLDSYPVFSLNVDEILEKTDVKSAISLPDSNLKIQISEYVRGSKLIKSIVRKLKPYGYGLYVSTESPDDEPFRDNTIKMSIHANHQSQETKKELIVKSEVLRDVFDSKKRDYDEILREKAEHENNQLIELVESGHFDDMVASRWVKATLMSTESVLEPHFKGERFVDEMTIDFTAPFNRELKGIKEFKRNRYVLDGIGTRYMNLEYNIVNVLKNRYTFLEHARLFDYSSFDYQKREIDSRRDVRRLIDDTLMFTFEIKQRAYTSSKNELFDWLASSYGLLDITTVLHDIQFDADGISEKIEDYIKAQSSGDTSTKEAFKIILGDIYPGTILNLYQENPLFSKTKQWFEKLKEKDLFWGLYGYNDEYKKEKLNEFQSLKLANLFAHALLVNPLFNEMKKELKSYDYELTIEFSKEKTRRMITGHKNLPGDDMSDDVCSYHVQIVIH